jgi:hypothetical protein
MWGVGTLSLMGGMLFVRAGGGGPLGLQNGNPNRMGSVSLPAAHFKCRRHG